MRLVSRWVGLRATNRRWWIVYTPCVNDPKRRLGTASILVLASMGLAAACSSDDAGESSTSSGGSGSGGRASGGATGSGGRLAVSGGRAGGGSATGGSATGGSGGRGGAAMRGAAVTAERVPAAGRAPPGERAPRATACAEPRRDSSLARIIPGTSGSTPPRSTTSPTRSSTTSRNTTLIRGASASTGRATRSIACTGSRCLRLTRPARTRASNRLATSTNRIATRQRRQSLPTERSKAKRVMPARAMVTAT